MYSALFFYLMLLVDGKKHCVKVSEFKSSVVDRLEEQQSALETTRVYGMASGFEYLLGFVSLITKVDV